MTEGLFVGAHSICARDIGETVRVILSEVHGTSTKPNREAATSEAKSGSRTNRPSQIPTRHAASLALRVRLRATPSAQDDTRGMVARDIGETDDILDSRGRLSLQGDIFNP